MLELYLDWKPLHYSNLKLCYYLLQLLEIVVYNRNLRHSRFDKTVEQVNDLSAVELLTQSEVGFCYFLQDDRSLFDVKHLREGRQFVSGVGYNAIGLQFSLKVGKRCLSLLQLATYWLPILVKQKLLYLPKGVLKHTSRMERSISALVHSLMPQADKRLWEAQLLGYVLHRNLASLL